MTTLADAVASLAGAVARLEAEVTRMASLIEGGVPGRHEAPPRRPPPGPASDGWRWSVTGRRWTQDGSEDGPSPADGWPAARALLAGPPHVR